MKDYTEKELKALSSPWTKPTTALYRTIPGPPEETAFTDEQLERYLAEVRREGYEAGVNDERLTHVPGWEDWMQGHAKGYFEGLEAAAKAVCTFCEKGDKPWKWGGILQGYSWFHADPKGELIEAGDAARSPAYCKATNIHKLMIAADQPRSS